MEAFAEDELGRVECSAFLAALRRDGRWRVLRSDLDHATLETVLDAEIAGVDRGPSGGDWWVAALLLVAREWDGTAHHDQPLSSPDVVY